MRTKELADFTGVSTRTINYYHSIGLLSPCPSSRTQATYTFQDAVKVLRIKRHAQLGLSLKEIKELLDTQEISNSLDVDGLIQDLTLTNKILQCQLATLQLINETQINADVPPSFATYIAALKKNGACQYTLNIEIANLLLASQILGDNAEGLSYIEEWLTKLTFNDELTASYVNLKNSFNLISESSSPDECERVIMQFVEWSEYIYTILTPPFAQSHVVEPLRDAFHNLNECRFNTKQKEINAEQKRRLVKIFKAKQAQMK